MTVRGIISIGALAIVTIVTPCRAQQQPPPVRPLGPITNVSRDSVASVAAAVEVAGGRVFVNDIVARRLLLYEPTLDSAVVIADSSGETSNAYGSLPATLLAYHGDSALFITPGALSMEVLSPSGAVARVMAMPPSSGGMPALIGSIFGTPGFDARGRLVYFAPFRMIAPPRSPGGELPRLEPPDSAFVVRFDFASRTLDTAATIRIPKTSMTVSRDDQGRFRLSMMAFPPRTVDDWAVTSDGALAVVRGQDYHVDWLSPDGTWMSTPRIPYAWERLSDEQKTALIDSTARAMQTLMDSLPARMQRATGGAAGPVTASGQAGRGAAGRSEGPGAIIITAPRGPGGPGGPGVPSSTTIMPTVVKADVADVPDYRPPFGQGAVRADRDGNLWIRTNNWVDGRPVYDVVNRRGEIADRVQLPPFRTIAGFGPGVVYMGVQDSTGVTHLERARMK
jgi:hypothetical protein